MRDRYFLMYQSIKFKQCFYETHKTSAKSKYVLSSCFLILISLACATLWTITGTHPKIWAGIIGTAQLAQALSVFLPWSKQLAALNFLLPELSKIIRDIDSDWLNLDVKAYDENKIKKLIDFYEERFRSLESQFTENLDFSERYKYLMAAEKRQRNYFYFYYPIVKELERKEHQNAG